MPYKLKIIEVLKVAFKTFGDNLQSVTLGGSGGKNKLIPGWSDLDFYIVLKKYDIDQIKKFMKIDLSNDIHIGTTFYTEREILNNIIDNKTKIMIYEKYHYNVNPTFYGEEIFRRNTFDEVKNNDINAFPNVLHEFRRKFIELDSGTVKLDKKYIKKMLVLLKCILSHFDIFATELEEVVGEFINLCNKEFNQCTTSYKFDILNVIKNIDTSKDEVILFSKYILNFIESNEFLLGGAK